MMHGFQYQARFVRNTHRREMKQQQREHHERLRCTQPCKHVLENGKCDKYISGGYCSFAHSLAQLRIQQCDFWPCNRFQHADPNRECQRLHRNESKQDYYRRIGKMPPALPAYHQPHGKQASSQASTPSSNNAENRFVIKLDCDSEDDSHSETAASHIAETYRVMSILRDEDEKEIEEKEIAEKEIAVPKPVSPKQYKGPSWTARLGSKAEPSVELEEVTERMTALSTGPTALESVRRVSSWADEMENESENDSMDIRIPRIISDQVLELLMDHNIFNYSISYSDE